MPTIDGVMADVKVDAGTQTGFQHRLRQKGMSVLRSTTRGDLYVELVVETPVKLSKHQRELLQEFSSGEEAKASHPESENFFKKVKELWSKK